MSNQMIPDRNAFGAPKVMYEDFRAPERPMKSKPKSFQMGALRSSYSRDWKNFQALLTRKEEKTQTTLFRKK